MMDEEIFQARELAERLAFEQIHGDAIVPQLKRDCGMTEEAAAALVHEMADELADARIRGQTAIVQRLWEIAFGNVKGTGVGTLTALAHQYCGWSQGGASEAVQKAMIAATRAQFGRMRAVG